MEEKENLINEDERTGGEAFLDLAAKQAMYNFVHGDKESLKIATELEHERVGFKDILEEDELKEKSNKSNNGRSKR